MTNDVPMQGSPSRPTPPNSNPLTDPASAPLGTTVVFPRWQDGHHPADIAIRWSPPNDVDEQRPWLILGSDGPQKLDHDAVEGCQLVNTPVTEPINHAAEAKRRLAEDALASIAHSLIELTGLMQHLAVPTRYVIDKTGPIDVLVKSAGNQSAQPTQRLR